MLAEENNRVADRNGNVDGVAGDSRFLASLGMTIWL